MAKKSRSHNGKKESHSDQDHAQKHGRGNDHENTGSYRQKDQGNGMAGGGKPKGNDWKAEDGNRKEKEWIPEVSNPNQQPWIPEVSTSPTSLFSRLKNACLPKALMLLLPFLAIGAYLLFAS